jgi:hypothetical protein
MWSGRNFTGRDAMTETKRMESILRGGGSKGKPERERERKGLTTKALEIFLLDVTSGIPPKLIVESVS